MSVQIETKLLESVLQAMRLVKLELQEVDRLGLSVAQFRLLDRLSGGPSRTCELAGEQGVSPPAMSSLVDGLVRRKLVIRIPSSKDRRVVQLSLTPRGRALRGKVRKAIDRMFLARLQSLSRGEIERLDSGLEILVKLVGNAGSARRRSA